MCSLDGQLMFDSCQTLQYGRSIHVLRFPAITLRKYGRGFVIFVYSCGFLNGNYVGEILVEVS